MPKEWWDYAQAADGSVIAAVYMDKKRNAHWLPLSDLPDSLVADGELEGFGINLVKLRAVRECELATTGIDPSARAVEGHRFDKGSPDDDLIDVLSVVRGVEPPDNP